MPQTFTSRRPTRLGILGVVVAALTVLPGCGGSGNPDSAATGSAGAKTVKFGLITQLSVAPYFVTEADGARAKAKDLGVELDVVDSGQDASKVITLTQTLLTSGVKGLGIVPSNTDIGPRVSKLTTDAKVPLVASDSPLKDAAGKSAPFVGLDNTGSGEQVGKILGREYAKRSWNPADTYYAVVEAPTLQVCMLRTDASVKVFREAVPGFPADHVLHLPYDGSVAKSTDSMRAAITAHPDAKHWVISSCNDDGVVGALKALQGKGRAATDALGVGLGGNLACTIYTDTYLAAGMPVSTYLDAGRIGATVVQTLYDIVVNKKSISGNVYVETPEIDKSNYAQSATCPK
jgi:L-arabinose transport system substrate-binding protein